MIQNVEQAIFCLMSPSDDPGNQLDYCKNCKFSEMCGRVVAIIAEFKTKMEEGGDEDDS